MQHCTFVKDILYLRFYDQNLTSKSEHHDAVREEGTESERSTQRIKAPQGLDNVVGTLTTHTHTHITQSASPSFSVLDICILRDSLTDQPTNQPALTQINK